MLRVIVGCLFAFSSLCLRADGLLKDAFRENCLLSPALSSLGGGEGARELGPVLGGNVQNSPGEILSPEFVAALDRLVALKVQKDPEIRPGLWHRDFSSVEAYEKSVQQNRDHLRELIGAADKRVSLNFGQNGLKNPVKVAEMENYDIFAVQWPVLEGVFGEGLWLKPKSDVLGLVIAIPDANQEPELIAGLAAGLKPEFQFARRAVENGFEVVVPVLISPEGEQREWICEKAVETGRHIVGLEAQKVMAALDWWFEGVRAAQQRSPTKLLGRDQLKVGIVGYGEGGLVALCAAALDRRIESVLVSAYFQNQSNAWKLPGYRNVFGMAREFGDAELATLVAPRVLFVEHASAFKEVETPEFESVEGEVERAKSLLKKGGDVFDRINFVCGTEGRLVGPLGEGALTQFFQSLGHTGDLKESGVTPKDLRPDFHPEERQRKQLAQFTLFLSPVSRISTINLLISKP